MNENHSSKSKTRFLFDYLLALYTRFRV